MSLEPQASTGPQASTERLVLVVPRGLAVLQVLEVPQVLVDPLG